MFFSIHSPKLQNFKHHGWCRFMRFTLVDFMETVSLLARFLAPLFRRLDHNMLANLCISGHRPKLICFFPSFFYLYLVPGKAFKLKLHLVPSCVFFFKTVNLPVGSCLLDHDTDMFTVILNSSTPLEFLFFGFFSQVLVCLFKAESVPVSIKFWLKIRAQPIVCSTSNASNEVWNVIYFWTIWRTRPNQRFVVKMMNGAKFDIQICPFLYHSFIQHEPRKVIYLLYSALIAK